MRMLSTAEEKKFFNLESETKRLTKGNVELVRQQNIEIEKLSNLKMEYITLDKDSKALVKASKEKANEIIQKAESIESEANKKKNAVDVKLGELEELKSQQTQLIKSTDSKEKNLILARQSVDEKEKNLNEVSDLIRKILR